MTDSEPTPTNESAEASTSVQAPSQPRWRILSVKPRVDSFNQAELMAELGVARREGFLSIAMDLRGNRFLSFPVIKLCVEIAQELHAKGGCFALVSYSEKTRRHFEIYGTVKHMLLARDVASLPAAHASEIPVAPMRVASVSQAAAEAAAAAGSLASLSDEVLNAVTGPGLASVSLAAAAAAAASGFAAFSDDELGVDATESRDSAGEPGLGLGRGAGAGAGAGASSRESDVELGLGRELGH